MTTTLTIRRPDDMHAHLRDGSMLGTVLDETARDFARAIVMPNLVPAVTTVEAAEAYRKRIMERLLPERDFRPLMTLYLTENTTPEEIAKAADAPDIHAFKYYPRGATTNSSEGVRSFDKVVRQLEAMERYNVPLLIHGEDNFDTYGEPLDPFDKERHFMDMTLPDIRKRHQGLRMVLEHITTLEAADYVRSEGGRMLGATITPHHLVCDRRALFDGGLNPHFFCLPVLKRSKDTVALRLLATEGNKNVFAGTDTAPHPTHAKERACGCAGGCFVAPIALSMYAQVFDEEHELLNLEPFLSENGAQWYGLPLNEGTLTLMRNEAPRAPDSLFWDIDAKVQIRPFGMHTTPDKSLGWHWSVSRS